MKIFITGGSGFIGTYLSQALIAYGHQITILDIAQPSINFSKFITDHKNQIQYISGSINDKEKLELHTKNVDLILHLGGIAEPMRYCTHPKKVMDVNLRGSFSVIDAAIKNNCKIFFASTSEIYGFASDKTYKETTNRVLGPTPIHRWCYSTSKAAIEHYLFACHQEEGLSFEIARFFNIYGYGLKGRVVTNFIEKALKNEPIIVHGDGQQIRSFLYIKDAISALEQIINREDYTNNIYNIGNPSPTKIIELAHLIKNICSSSSPIVYKPYKEIHESFSDIPLRVPNISKIKQAFVWSPTTNLVDGLKLTVEKYILKPHIQTRIVEDTNI